MIVQLALRNVLRNRWRSALSALALLVGVSALVFGHGFMNGLLQGLVEDAVLAKIGAIQLHRSGYLDAEQDPLTFDLPDDPALVARLRAIPGVRAVSRRIYFEGSISNGNISAVFAGTAIDPSTEYQVCPRRRQLVAAGSSPLAPGDETGVLLGSALADGLGAGQGVALIASATTQTGTPNALDVSVHGLLPEADPFETKSGVLMPLALAQALLRMQGRVTEYVLDVEDLERVETVATALRAALGAGHEVHTWRDRKQIRDFSERMGAMLGLATFILVILVLSAIVNTMLMSVYERVREIGTMMAIGVRRREVLAMFLVEGAALGLIGAAAGVGVGLGLIALAAGGIHFPATTLSGPLVIYPHVGARFLLVIASLAVLGAILAALHPAWKASRMHPTDALRAT